LIPENATSQICGSSKTVGPFYFDHPKIDPLSATLSVGNRDQFYRLSRPTNFKIQCFEICAPGWTGLGEKMDAWGDVARATL